MPLVSCPCKNCPLPGNPSLFSSELLFSSASFASFPNSSLPFQNKWSPYTTILLALYMSLYLRNYHVELQFLFYTQSPSRLNSLRGRGLVFSSLSLWDWPQYSRCSGKICWMNPWVPIPVLSHLTMSLPLSRTKLFLIYKVRRFQSHMEAKLTLEEKKEEHEEKQQHKEQ